VAVWFVGVSDGTDAVCNSEAIHCNGKVCKAYRDLLGNILKGIFVIFTSVYRIQLMHNAFHVH